MQKIFLSGFLAVLLLFCFSQDGIHSNPAFLLNAYKEADKIYQHAEYLAVKSETNESLIAKADNEYQLALSKFLQLIPDAQKTTNDSLSFLLHLKTGLIFHYFDSLELAKKHYLSALAFKNAPGINDTLFFKPTLFSGSIFYQQNNLDSATRLLKEAEEINDQYKNRLDGSERLFNLLGVIHYETGNYRQAVNYFEKALSLLTELNPAEKSLQANYKINIASTLMKIDEDEAARKIFEDVLQYDLYNNELYQKLGIIYLKEKNFKKAINYLRQVNYENSKKTIDLYLNFSMAYSGIGQPDSVELYLHKALAENLKWNGHQKNISYGLILKFQADEKIKQRSYKEAINLYQEAVLQFHQTFKETDINKNPEQYSGVYSFINLFNTLVAKASSFESWFRQEKDIDHLKASLNAYQSAFALAGYVEKTYDSDEARLFLGKIKYTVHSKPIDVCIELFELTKKRSYLEDAYFIDQQNKASILVTNVQENELRNKASGTNTLIQELVKLKTTITRLTIKASQSTDSISLLSINEAIRDNEISLRRLEEKLHDNPAWQESKSIEQIPAVNQLQKSLDNSTALLSFHLSENELLTILIAPNRLDYFRLAIDTNFLKTIDTFKNALHNTNADQRFNGNNASNRLYQLLIEPALPKLLQTKRLIIIPDDELNYLPFEALLDKNDKYLIESFSIQYQFTTALLEKNKTHSLLPGTLSFAPFTAKEYRDSSGYSLSRLPASKEEIASLKGKIFIDSAATMKSFQQFINKYGTLHLATHAIVNNRNPSLSFIAFYPGDNNYRLYAPEIANLRLDSTQLVILSACETGDGPLVKGEGLMSLSRAFAYAGCPDVITSLWKAEDKTTAFLTRQLHYYLGKNYTKDKALQQAKLDLLARKEIDPRFKSPVYWAHLIFIGEYEIHNHSSNWWWIALLILIASTIYIIVKRKSPPEK
jgi:CHAT domain-containing protein/tetratricopeptide (TPR) repeat protein